MNPFAKFIIAATIALTFGRDASQDQLDQYNAAFDGALDTGSADLDTKIVNLLGAQERLSKATQPLSINLNDPNAISYLKLVSAFNAAAIATYSDLDDTQAQQVKDNFKEAFDLDDDSIEENIEIVFNAQLDLVRAIKAVKA